MSAAALVFAVSNLIVAAGYAFITFSVAPNFVVHHVATKLGALTFFAASAIVHAEIARYTFVTDEVIMDSPYNVLMVATQVVLAVAVWTFIAGLWLEMRTPPADTPRVRDDGE